MTYTEEMTLGSMSPEIDVSLDDQDPERGTEQILNKFLLLFSVRLREKVLILQEQKLLSLDLRNDVMDYFSQLSTRGWELFRRLTPEERKTIIHHPKFNQWAPVIKHKYIYNLPTNIADLLDNAIYRQLHAERPDLPS